MRVPPHIMVRVAPRNTSPKEVNMAIEVKKVRVRVPQSIEIVLNEGAKDETIIRFDSLNAAYDLAQTLDDAVEELQRF